jgi:uncharacterized protein YecT (DUF1311 family)
MRLLLAVALILLAAVPAVAQQQGEDEDPIDQAMNTCLDRPEGQSTQGMVECFGASYEAWDKALNDAYGELTDTLNADQKALLKTSQRQWIVFRDAESKFLDSLITPDSGSIMRVVINQAMSDMVKARVLALRSYSSQ